MHLWLNTVIEVDFSPLWKKLAGLTQPWRDQHSGTEVRGEDKE